MRWDSRGEVRGKRGWMRKMWCEGGCVDVRCEGGNRGRGLRLVQRGGCGDVCVIQVDTGQQRALFT